ncbi:MAG: PTS ascorbate transporter subunit IIB [Erysipelotrichaceae bacterium]|nr:PTS ascorbate transporter subunit IIB [Erysipelotrichaceae bacterium]
MLKVLVACGNGMGTSMLIKNRAEKTFKKLGLDATFDHSGLDEAAAAAAQYDLVFTPMNLVKQFDLPKSCTTKIIGMVNVLSEQEMVDRLRENGVID